MKQNLPTPAEPLTQKYPLNKPLIHFSESDAWTIRDACEGVQIFGAIGSGKTSGSCKSIAQSFLGNGFGG